MTQRGIWVPEKHKLPEIRLSHIMNIPKVFCQDKKKTILQRLKDKESPKGAPFKQWFHYLHKNYGIAIAVLRCWTPYIKLFFGK